MNKVKSKENQKDKFKNAATKILKNYYKFENENLDYLLSEIEKEFDKTNVSNEDNNNCNNKNIFDIIEDVVTKFCASKDNN